MNMEIPPLPNEIWLMIFNKLNDLNEILKFRLVNRNWNEMVKCFRTKSLIIYRSRIANKLSKRIDPFKSGLYDSFDDKLKSDEFQVNLWKSKLMKTILSKIEKLCIAESHYLLKRNWSNMESTLEQFSQLKYLSIDRLMINRSRSLKLNNVQILSIGDFPSYSCLTLDMPKLVKFHTNENNSRIKFVHASTVNHLSLDFAFNLPDLENIEKLNLKNFMHDFAERILSQYPKLKELSIQSASKRELIEFFKKKRILRNLNVKINLFGFKLEDANELDEFFDENGVLRLNTQTIINNYEKFEGVYHSKFEVNINEIIDHFDEIPVDFCSKFIEIFKLVVNKPVRNEDDLIKFLANCKSINRLEFSWASLNQSFYSKLPLLCSTKLTHLKIEENENIISDFNFIICLENLKEFSFNHKIPLQIIRYFYEDRRLSTFKFVLNNEPITIELNRSYSINPLPLKGTITFSNHKFDHTSMNDQFDFIDALQIFFGFV